MRNIGLVEVTYIVAIDGLWNQAVDSIVIGASRRFRTSERPHETLIAEVRGYGEVVHQSQDFNAVCSTHDLNRNREDESISLYHRMGGPSNCLARPQVHDHVA